MKKQVFRVNSDGFNGAWYPAPGKSNRGLIIMLGDSSEDHMARTGAKWLHEQGLHVMAMSADKKDYGHHNYPLERFGIAIDYMKAQGCEKLGCFDHRYDGAACGVLLPGAVADDRNLASGLRDGRLLPGRKGRHA